MNVDPCPEGILVKGMPPNILFSTLRKVESVDNSHNMLYTEYQVYSRHLKGFPGFAKVYRWAHTKKWNYMVMELLGKDLGSLFKRRDHHFSLDTVCLIAVQVLSRLEKYSSKILTLSKVFSRIAQSLSKELPLAVQRIL